MNLGMAYVANISDVLATKESNSLMAASTQIFPVVSCSSEIVKDPVLIMKFSQMLSELIDQLKTNSESVYDSLRHFAYDLYTIDKP